MAPREYPLLQADPPWPARIDSLPGAAASKAEISRGSTMADAPARSVEGGDRHDRAGGRVTAERPGEGLVGEAEDAVGGGHQPVAPPVRIGDERPDGGVEPLAAHGTGEGGVEAGPGHVAREDGIPERHCPAPAGEDPVPVAGRGRFDVDGVDPG